MRETENFCFVAFSAGWFQGAEKSCISSVLKGRNRRRRCLKMKTPVLAGVFSAYAAADYSGGLRILLVFL